MNGSLSLVGTKVRLRQSLYSGGSARRVQSSLLGVALLCCLFTANPELLFATSATPQLPSVLMQTPDSYSRGGGGVNILSTPSLGDTTLGSEDREAISRVLKNAIATQPIAPSSDGGSQTSLITQEIRYELAEAGEVSLGWGINGWQPLPEELRPRGTKMYNGIMNTPMTHEGNTFVVKVQVPPSTIIVYGFWISKTRSGQDVGIWDGNGYPAVNYQTIARADHPAVVLGTLNLEKAQAESNRTYAPFVTQEIHYHTSTIGGVSLVWGINGWQTIPDDLRPLGTTIHDKLMHTPMAQTGNTFVAKVQVPPGAIIDFAFLITKTNDGANTKIWDRADDFWRIATTNGIIDIASKAGVAQDPLQSEPRGNISESSVLMQELRNHKVYWLILAFLAFSISVLISLKLRKTI